MLCFACSNPCHDAALCRVIKEGHRGGMDYFAALARNADSEWTACEFDGIDNSHTQVPSLRFCKNKNYNSLEMVKFKTTGFVEFGRGSNFWHCHPWVGCHRSVNLNVTALLMTLAAILERDEKLDPNLFLQCDAGDGNWDDGQIVMLAILVQVDMVNVLMVHRSPVAHTHNIGDAYWSIHSTRCKGRHGVGGHDICNPDELLESFHAAYSDLQGDVKLRSNKFVEATLDFKSIAEEYKHEDFSLGGLLQNYLTRTDTVNPQKFQETHALKFEKDSTGHVKMKFLTRQDFIDGKRMQNAADWGPHEVLGSGERRMPVTVLKVAPSAAALKTDLLAKMTALPPSGWRTVLSGDSEGWSAAKKSETDVLNYARRQKDRFSDDAVAGLEGYYRRVPHTERAFNESLPGLDTPSLGSIFTYCANVNTARAEHSAAINSQRINMALSGAGTVPNVRDPEFTRRNRVAAQRASASTAEYQTDAPVKIGEYVFAQVVHDAESQAVYELPLSFGIVHRIIKAAGNDSDSGNEGDELVDESTDPSDQLEIGWFQPIAKVPLQKYGPGFWELKSAESGSAIRDYRTTILRGAVVIADVQEDSLTAKVFLPGNRVLIKCKFGKALLRKIKQLPNAVTHWSKYGLLAL